jgi:arylsulfatase A-like enzyme
MTLPRSRAVVVSLVVSLLVAGGWWVLQPNFFRRDVPVIIYLVDTLRADRLGFYGYARPTSPELEALAADSVVFEQAYAPAPWTLPSVAGLITSTFSCENGMTERKKLNPALKTLAERLNAAGYFTGGVYHNIWIGPLAGLDRGYEIFNYRVLEKDQWLADIRQLLDQVDDRPFFAYLHIMEPHDTYSVPYPYISPVGHVSLEQRLRYKELFNRLARLRQTDWIAEQPIGTTDNTEQQQRTLAALTEMREPIGVLYDAAIRWSDATLGDVVRILRKRGIWDEAIFIFLSDHGEELLDHGALLHGQSVYEELARVPLLIHFPGGDFGGRRIETPVNLVDIMPTIFAYLGRPELCDGCRGSSLIPLLSGGGRSPNSISSLRMSRAFYYRPDKERRGDVNLALRDGRWKGIWNAELQYLELYDLQHDPGEQTDVSAEHPERAKILSDRAREWLRDCAARAKPPAELGEIDPETMEQLRSLGYFN